LRNNGFSRYKELTGAEAGAVQERNSTSEDVPRYKALSAELDVPCYEAVGRTNDCCPRLKPFRDDKAMFSWRT
jgi:hypothetical protein